MTVFSGAERRRHWSDDEKIDLVAKAFAPGAIVARVARSADVHPSQLYRWRAEFSKSEAARSREFAELVVGAEGRETGGASYAIQVRLEGAVVNISNAASSDLVEMALKVLAR